MDYCGRVFLQYTWSSVIRYKYNKQMNDKFENSVIFQTTVKSRKEGFVMKTLKRSLFSSILSLFLCVAMLLGTTYAWFTDSVTSAGNKIVSGSLKVDLELLDENN